MVVKGSFAHHARGSGGADSAASPPGDANAPPTLRQGRVLAARVDGSFDVAFLFAPAWITDGYILVAKGGNPYATRHLDLGCVPVRAERGRAR